MDWVKKTDSAGRSGINDYINAPQRVSSKQVRAKKGSLEEIVTSQITGDATRDIKNKYGVFDNTLNVLANRTLFYNSANSDNPLNIQANASGEVFISNQTDSSGNANINKALKFDKNGNIILTGNINVNNIDNSKNNVTVFGELSCNNLYLVGSSGPQSVVNYDISGDASFNGRVFLYQGNYASAKPAGIFISDPSNLVIESDSKERAVQAILKDRFDISNTDKKINKLSIAFGYDNSENEQTELWFNRPKSDGSNNFGSLGLHGNPSLIAWNNKGGLSVNRNYADTSNLMQDLSIFDISNSVRIVGSKKDHDTLDTSGSLRVESFKLHSAGAAIVLVGKRSENTETADQKDKITYADIIFKNKTDKSVPATNSHGNEKIHGIIKTMLKDASKNSGDMIFYGQSKDSISSNTDSSGITEFMKYNASNETVHFPKIVSIGNSFDNSYGCIYPDPSAILDLRTFTEYGGADTGSSDFHTWQAGNVLLNCQNFNSTGGYNNVENGIVWQPLARNITSDTVYTKESAAVKFIPEDDYFRGGLGFFTNNTGNENIDAKLRMKIDQSGNVDICGGKVTINNFTSEYDPSGTLVDLSYIRQNGAFKIIDPNKVILKPTINQLILGDNSINSINKITLTVDSSNNRNEMALFQSNAEAAHVTVKNNGQTEAQIGVSGDSIFIKKNNGGGKIEFYPNSEKAMDIDNSANVNVMKKMVFKSQEAGLLFDNSLTIGPFTDTGKTNLYMDNLGNIRLAPNEVTDEPKTFLHLMKNMDSAVLNTSFSQGCLMHVGNDYSYNDSKYVIGFGPTKDNGGNKRQFPAAYIGYEHTNNNEFGTGALIFGVNETGKDEEAKKVMTINTDGTVSFTSKINLTETQHTDVEITGRLAIGVSGDFFTKNPEISYPTELTVNGDSIMYNKLTVSGDTFLASKLTVSGDIIGDVTGDVNGNAATATALATARNIGGVSFNGTANIDLPGVNAAGNQNTSGIAATATKIASITNSNIVQLDDTQTLTNKSLTSPTITGTLTLGDVVNIEGNVTMGTSPNTYKFILNGEELTHHGGGASASGGSPTFTGTVTALSFNATSDVNKKEDIETISDATEKLTSLRGVSYKLKEEEEKKTHYGVVAQEIERIFPDMVSGEEGNKSVAYMEIIGVLIETVKDLNKRIQKLEESSK
jgi:cytoskeletal protein CcmA (bactofilin family)